MILSTKEKDSITTSIETLEIIENAIEYENNNAPYLAFIRDRKNIPRGVMYE